MWISAETVQNLQKRRDKHTAVLNSRTREVKRKAATELLYAVKESARAYKRNYLRELAETTIRWDNSAFSFVAV